MKTILALALLAASYAHAEMACLPTDVSNTFQCRETIETAGQYLWTSTDGSVYPDPASPSSPWRQYFDCARRATGWTAYVTVAMPLWGFTGLTHTHPAFCAASAQSQDSRLAYDWGWDDWTGSCFFGHWWCDYVNDWEWQ